MIPYAVDASFDRRPVVNWVIFGGLALVFAIQLKVTGQLRVTAEQMEPFALHGWGIGLLSHNWLHANILQLVANLLFLWPFGNAVCAKIGNKPYIGVYLGLCLVGGIIHLLVGLLFGSTAAFGPAVAINCIVGMYLVFFPENTISCLFLVPHPVTFDIAGYFFIVVWFIVDIFVVLFHVPSVTYVAHIMGFGAGFGLAVLMLKKKWVVMDKDDKSLLDVLRKKEEAEEEGKEPVPAEKAPKSPDEEEIAPPKTAPAEAETPTDDFIRFYCQCGKRIKVPKELAGSMGLCPRCKRQVKVPKE